MDSEKRSSNRVFKAAHKTLYLHGFLSSEQSKKGQWFVQANQAQQSFPLGELLTLGYRQSDLLTGIGVIEKQLQTWHSQGASVVLIGSSLGGYLAQYFAHKYACAYIMINPALNPLSLFDTYLGEHRNPYTQEVVHINAAYKNQLAQLEITPLNPMLASLLLVDDGDEVVDIDFACALYQDLPNARVCRYPGGNHAFTHLPEAWLEINNFIDALENV
ncbi:esterase YqiA [Thiosulfatimonas sediminis]|uniref:Esterase YqiA n=1 Tax=Thiosulfatimonas sediminis TaxID=2675054 RepID=A0A6F8PV98_9GAMM|nr:YqiA/YcfP family alpha/beta fold hydrolase [Thiosulfatimonas sediminis]BBP45934.1 esterase YqiA [Thiosulfatimonas sediminis]